MAATVDLTLEDGSRVCSCRLADTFLTRLRGLMFTRELPRGRGLLFPRARSVHTHFMRYPIDVVFLDERDVVVRVVPALRPWRAAGERAASAVLELAAGECERLGVAVGTALRRAE